MKPLFGKDNPMFGRKQTFASNQRRREKLIGIRSSRKGKSYVEFYGHEQARLVIENLKGHSSWNKVGTADDNRTKDIRNS